MWNRHHLFLCDLPTKPDYEFVLDDDGRFATLEHSDSKQSKEVAAVMDLRDDYIVVVYYFGDSKICARINQLLKASPNLHACYLGMSIFEQVVCELEQITHLEFDFEQQSAMFSEPVNLKGTISGQPAQLIYHQYLQNHKPFFNIQSISGRISDESHGKVIFQFDGMAQVDDCRLSDFMQIVKLLFLLLRLKYKSLADKCILKWSGTEEKNYISLDGNMIEFNLNKPIEKLEGLIRYLVKGDKQLLLYGSSERISRKLWSVKSINVNSKSQIELEVSDAMVRVYLKNRTSIPLLDSIEDFIRKHIAADIENSSF
ncbi:hypothetical protein KJ966_12635 [bacterium]|nr:hypothetical protein [bacterium]